MPEKDWRVKWIRGGERFHRFRVAIGNSSTLTRPKDDCFRDSLIYLTLFFQKIFPTDLIIHRAFLQEPRHYRKCVARVPYKKSFYPGCGREREKKKRGFKKAAPDYKNTAARAFIFTYRRKILCSLTFSNHPKKNCVCVCVCLFRSDKTLRVLHAEAKVNGDEKKTPTALSLSLTDVISLIGDAGKIVLVGRISFLSCWFLLFWKLGNSAQPIKQESCFVLLQ